jgi:PAS domain S-box-containing protein/diguanylate cyclase (GGDEF)-like protein
MLNNEPNIELAKQNQLHILFVEDAATDFDLCLREFEKANMKVNADRVTTSEEFQSLLATKTYDIILADYCLPSWTGMEAFEVLRQRGDDIPLILVTGTLGDETAVACIKKGVTDYVLKDQLGALPAAVCRALEEQTTRKERNRAEMALRESERRFRALAERIASAAFIYQGTECRYANHAAEELTGYSREELLALNSWDLVHPDSRSVVTEHGLAHLRGGRANAHYEMKILTKRGEVRWLDVTVGRIEFDGQPAGLTTAFDTTDHKLSEELLRRGGVSDPLTGLAKNTHLEEVFSAEVKRSQRSGLSFALLLLKLDVLRQVREELGYPVGSRALCRLANVIGLSCRNTDTAARNSEDEFGMLLPETSAAGVRQVASRILERLKNDGGEPAISVSTGAAVFPQDGETFDHLLSAAKRNLRKSESHTTGKVAISA